MIKAIDPAVERQQKLDAVIRDIQKQFGETSSLKAVDAGSSFLTRENVLSSGILTLDIILNGGYPKGRMIEISGLESSGKSTIALRACASCQQENGNVVYMDAEGTFDKDYASLLGVDNSKLILSKPQSGEDAMDIIHKYISTGVVDLIVVDSVASLVPKAEAEASASDAHMGLQARMLSGSLRKFTRLLDESKCTILFLNQIRDLIGVIYGKKTTTPGGHALKFYSSVRIEVSRGLLLKSGTDVVGQTIRCAITKNKTGGDPKKKCECALMYKTGISEEEMVVNVAVQYGIIQKAGSWYSYNEQKVGQGADSVKNKMEQDEAFLNEIKEKVLEAAFYFWKDEKVDKKKKKKSE